MKKISTILAVFCALVLLAAPRATRAQSITLDSISGTTFCSGDPFSVTFTATGNWSQNKNNAFSIQLSDINGSFANIFTILGSLKDTADGTFTITSAITGGTSTHYRIRIAGSNPYVPSADNGQDITVGVAQSVDLEIADFTTYVTTSVGGLYLPVGAQVDSSVQILLPNVDTSVSSTTTYDWDFGSGATPPNASGLGLIENDVTYSTAGDKTVGVKLTGSTGCTTSASIKYHVFDCTNPSIPKYAVIDSVDNQYIGGGGGRVIWVNPGVTLNLNGGKDTIFCESNSTINAREAYSVYYLKPGASLTEMAGYNTIIHADGVSLDFSGPPYRAVIDCPTLDFDYTVAPPNYIMGINVSESVTPSAPVAQIEIYPNPTNGNVTLENIPMGANVIVMNVLGETVQTENARGNTNLTLDLSTFTAGTYYIRIASGNSVMTKSIVKE